MACRPRSWPLTALVATLVAAPGSVAAADPVEPPGVLAPAQAAPPTPADPEPTASHRGVAPRDPELARQAPSRAWSLSVGTGIGGWLFEGLPLNRQLQAAGYRVTPAGWSFEGSVDRYVLDWLVVGVNLDVQLHLGARDQDLPASLGERDEGIASDLWRVSIAPYAQPTFCVERRCEHDGLIVGLQLAFGGGPTLWTLRDAVETAPHLVGTVAVVWQLWGRSWGLGARLSCGVMWQDGLGPRDLGRGLYWAPGLSLRVNHRW